jgi:predicted N-formylglutamate amidohydrolase
MSLQLQTLLGPKDPKPIEIVRADSASDILLLCEHAGNAIPGALGDLGVSREVIESHRGWDIGAQSVARALAERLGAPLVIQNYSRLVLDCNRPPESDLAIPAISDQVAVLGNAGLSAEARAMRVDEIFRPMDTALEQLFDCHPRRAAFSIHSFTASLNGTDRPWHAGFLSRARAGVAAELKDHIAQARPEMRLAVNEPYQIETEGDWFIPAHAERRNLAHCLIEIRNDQLATQAGIDLWADLLAEAILAAIKGDRK